MVLFGLVATRVRNAIFLSCLLFLTLPLAARIVLISPAALFDRGMREIAFVRLDAIGYGVVVAWAHMRMPDFLARWQGWLFLAGCFMLLGPIDLLAALDDQTLFETLRPFLFNFTSIGFALWVPAALHLRIRSAWFDAAVRWLSERSYCLYIVHLSIIDIVWRGGLFSHLPTLLRSPLVLVASAVLAEVSFRFLETPLLRLRPNQFATSTKAAADATEPQGESVATTRALRVAG
jgi:peptidoglycan/LPS O-acetylase OafA/YrhL